MGMIGNTLAQGLISGANIQDGTVDTADIKSNAITPSKLSIGAPSWDSAGVLTVGSGLTTTTATQYLSAGSGGSSLIGKISGSNTWFVGDTYAALGSGTGMTTYVYGANPWIVYTNAAERARIDASGNLGIGTTSPSSSGGGGLTLGTTSAGKSFNIYSSSYANNGVGNFYGTDGALKLQMGALSGTSAFIYAHTGCSLNLYSGGAQTAILDPSGNFGVGTSSPSVKFHIVGNSSTTQIRAGTSTVFTDWGTDATGTYLENTGSSSATRAIRIQAQNGSNSYAAVKIDGGDSTIRFTTSNSERARIHADGNFTVAGYNVMRFRGGVAWGDVDSYWGSAYDGYYSIAFSGHSGWLFVQNSASSAGTIQMYSTYFDGPWYRSRTDNASWTSWRQL